MLSKTHGTTIKITEL